MSDLTTQLQLWTDLLDLPDFEVVEAREDRPAQVRSFVLTPRLPVALCPHCGRPCQERHLCYDRQVQDLPLGAYATRLILRLWQFRCEGCDRFFSPAYAALADGAHATERFLERMAELVRHSDLANAAAYLGVAPKTLEGWYYDYVRRRQRPQEQLKPITSLGIDELSLKKDTGSTASC